MPITDADLVKGDISLEEVCRLYSDLDSEVERAGDFIHAKGKGMSEAYDEVREYLPGMFAKAEVHNLDKFPSFRKMIDILKEKYNLDDEGD